jgi:hypothetical protein
LANEEKVKTEDGQVPSLENQKLARMPCLNNNNTIGNF